MPICDMAAMAINVRLLEQSGLIVREVAHLPKVLRLRRTTMGREDRMSNAVARMQQQRRASHGGGWNPNRGVA